VYDAAGNKVGSGSASSAGDTASPATVLLQRCRKLPEKFISSASGWQPSADRRRRKAGTVGLISWERSDEVGPQPATRRVRFI
jgi:hypothetical protein